MKEFLKSVYAGVCIALGGFAYVQCEPKALGAFLFCLGLYAVLAFRLNLYTGKVCSFGNFKKPLRLLLIVLGNAIGATAFGIFVSYAAGLQDKAIALCAAKTAKTLPELAVSGIVCGACVAVAVKGYARAEANGKFLLVILGVMTFVLCGGEHVVADMFYVALAKAPNPASISAKEWAFLGEVLAFNTIGGLAFGYVDDACNEAVSRVR